VKQRIGDPPLSRLPEGAERCDALTLLILGQLLRFQWLCANSAQFRCPLRRQSASPDAHNLIVNLNRL
jgi:hypothetical protein